MKIEYNNSSSLLCVIGDPIAHSRSPLLQNTMLRELNEDAVYLAVRVPSGGAGDFLTAAKTIGIRGFNLTMPHKEDIIPHLHGLTEEAALCGSVNSVRIINGRAEGHTTDGLGFRRSLRDFGMDYPGKVVTILGAGGAAKSVAVNASLSGAKEVRVVNRTLSRAEKLCQGKENMSAHSLSELCKLLPDTDLLVNCTPMGMEGSEAASVPDLSPLKPGALCMDCVYAPAMTPFMAEARRHGHDAGNGIGMLVYQAIYALSFFLDRPFDEDTVSRLGKALMDISGVDPRGN